MLRHNSVEEENRINEVLPAKMLSHLIKDDITTALKCITTIIYKNDDAPDLCNVVIDKTNNTYKFWDGNAWCIAPIGQFIQRFYIRIQQLLRKIQKPIEYYMDSNDPRQAILDDDPYQLMKYLDAFVNNDDGYGWEMRKNISRDRITEAIVNCIL
jgi:hypothetical protein